MRTVATRKKAPGAKPQKRHYCTTCGRKRKENDMRVIGRAAWGKQKWQCLEACYKMNYATAYNRNNK